ncbi:MAG TPA: MarR family winged helix-turn-helix transcriptional regulator [Polyangiaceae bacterium]|nr:MarR family winged helix-turn-helix transcriptional regulator [Polyangiaceae bacterium]
MGSQVKPSSSAAPAAKRPRGRAAGPAAGAAEETRQILNSLRQIVRSLRISSRNAEQQVGLSGAQLFVLQCLASQGPCSVNQLAAASATDQSSVSVVVSRLVARGYVKRVTSKLDRRSVELSLTPAGRTLLLAAPEAAQERLLGALDKLKKSERLVLSGLLSKLVELAEVSGESPSLFFEEGPALVRSKGRSGDARR